jgi:heterotetrameric sarcosine oxidase gamma subunit
MTDYNPIFHSPITPISHRPSPILHPASQISNLTLSDLTGVPIILIQGEVGDILKQHFVQIPAKPGDLVEVSGGLLARLTPAEFYLFGLSLAANLPSAATLDNSFAQNQRFAHATDITHGKAVLQLAGVAASEVLSKICGLDFHPTVFPSQRVAQTSAAKIKTLIARYDEGETPAYFLHVSRPLGQYFWETMWDAGQEFGLTTADEMPFP